MVSVSRRYVVLKMNADAKKARTGFCPDGTGWCALVLASSFALLSLMLILAELSPNSTPDAASVFMPLISFVTGHIFAFVALASTNPPNRRSGKLAMRILWISLGLLAITASIAERHSAPAISQ